MDLTKALESGNIGYILIAFGAISVIFLWRQNVWLTKELLKLSTDTTKVIGELKNAINELRNVIFMKKED